MKKIFYFFMALLISQNVLAVDKTWTGTTSTDWNTASNWSPSGVPTSSDYVTIANGTPNPVLSTTATVISVQMNNSKRLTISSTGRLNLIGDGGSVPGLSFYESSSVQNDGSIYIEATNGSTLSFTDIFWGANSNGSSLINNGFIRINSNTSVISLRLGNTITNNSCGKITLLGGGNFSNGGVVSNSGLIETASSISQSGTFTNNGILKYNSLSGGTITNNNNASIIIINNSTPIFTYGGTYNGTVNGIYTNTGATTSAGTFTAPNTFVPSIVLPTGSQTLYAKITPSDGACNYVVPFTYNNLLPEINVKGNGVSIPDFDLNPTTTDHTDFGTTYITSGTVIRTFTIENTGLGALYLTGSPKVAISGTNASDFTVNVQPNSPVAATNGTTTFQVTFVPSASGTRNATITIDNNDSNENNYRFSIRGTGTNLCATVATSTEFMSWNGSVNNDWTNACNWTPNGVPSVTNSELSINASSNNPIITGAVTVKKITIQASATLTVASGATLNLTNDVDSDLALNVTGSFVNNGTTNVSTTGAGTTGIVIDGATSGVFTNNGSLMVNTLYKGFYIENANKSIYNDDTGILNVSGAIGIDLYGSSTFTNNGTYNFSGSELALIVSTSGSFINNKIVNITNGSGVHINASSYLTNAACATFISTITGGQTFTVYGFVTNSGLIQNAGQLVNTGSFNNLGVLKYSSLTGSISNSSTGSVVVNNAPTPIFTYGGTYNGTINGIFTDAAATTSAGTFTAPNTFTPSGLPVGSLQTLYAKITPSGGACTYVVPFTYIICNLTLTAGAVTNPVTCGGTGSIAFTTTNLSNGTYSLTYTGTGSPKSITIASNAFSLTGLTAGSYNNFSITSGACTASTGTLSPAKILADPATPTITAGAVTSPTTCGGANGSIAFTSTNLPNGTYSLTYTGTGSPKSITVASNAFSLTGLSIGNYNNFSVTSAGCTGTTGTLSPAKTVTNPAAPTLTAGTASNPTTCGGANGSIAFTSTNLPNGTYSLTYIGTGSPKSITVASNAFSLTGLSIGNYNNFSVTSAGCTGTTGTLSPAKTVANPASPTLTAGTVSNPTTCGGANGSIPFTSTNLPNGTYSLSFTATGTGATTSPKSVTVSANAFSLSGLKAGTYSAFSVTSAGCTGIVATSKVLTDPAALTLTAGTVTNPTTCGGANGIIPFTSTNLPNGTYSLSFMAIGTGATTSPQSITVSGNAFSLTGLKAGTYSAFSVTSAGCTGSVATSKVLTDPVAPTLTAGTATNPITCGGTGGIAFTTTNLPNGTYSLSFTATGTGATSSPQSITVLTNAFTLLGLKAGTYSSFSVTNAGCTGSVATSKVLTDPAAPTLTVGTATNPTTCGGANGSIAFTTTNLSNSTHTFSYKKGTTTINATLLISSNQFTYAGLTQESYSTFSITNMVTGCSGGEAAGTTSTVNLIDPVAPILTAGTAINPTTCAGANGSIPFTSTNLPNGTYSLSFTATGAGATTSPKNITVSANAFSLTGLKAGTYSAFSLTNAGCTGLDASSKILTDPTTATILAGTVVNPATCGATGSIPFTSTNLLNGTYSLSFTATGAGATTSPRNVTVTSNVFSLGSLSIGNYSGFSLTSTGCTAMDASSKSIANPTTPTLTAGTAVNPTVCGGTDGSIPFTTNLPDGTYSLSYTGTGSPKSINVSSGAFTLVTLGSGGFSNFSVTNNGCTGIANTPKSLSDPAAPVLTLGISTNPTACNLSDGSIAFTVTNITDGTYSLTYSGAGTPQSITISSGAFTLSGLADGTYSSFSITNGSGCTGSLATPVTLIDLALPVLTVGVATNPTTCAGTNGTITFTSTNLPDGTYSLSFTTTGTASPKSITVASNAFMLSGLSAGNYSNFSVTRSGCTGMVTTLKTLSNPASPSLAAGTHTNPTTCSGTDGTIAFTTTNLANGTYSLSFTTTGTSSPKSIIVTNNTFTLTGLSAGNYGSFSLTNNGCTAMDEPTITLNNPATPTITAGLVTAPTSCSASDGSIAFTSTNLPNGSYTITYTGTGSPKTVTVASNTFSLTGLDDGTYSNFSITNVGCTASDATNKTVNNPAAPTLTVGTATNPTTCASTDGTIAFTTTLPNGTYTINYTGLGSPKTVTVTSGAFTLTGLPDGTFSGFSVTTGGCTGTSSATKTLTDPALPTLTAGTATNPTTCLGFDGTIAFTTSLPNGTYSLSYTGSGSPKSITVTSGSFILTGLPDGTFSGFSVTTGGCTGTASETKTLTDPASPTLTAGTVTNPTTCLSSDGTIAFTTSLPNGTYSLSYTGSGSPQSITVTSGSFILTGLTDGTFSGFSLTTGGCTGTSSATKTLTNPASPTLTAGTVTNPTTCLSSDGTIAFTTSLPNGTYSLSYTGSGSPQSIMVTSGSFILTGLPDGTFSGFSITTGGCTGTSSATKTLTDPAAPTLTVGTVSNPVTCSDSDGSITFSTTLANGTYTLNYTGSSSPQSITVASGAFTLIGLSAGTYNGFSVTTDGCTGIANETKTLTDPIAPIITAGIATNLTTCSGTDGSIAFTSSNLVDGTYSLSFIGTGSGATASPQSITVASGAFSLTGLSAGVYSDFSVTNTGCRGTDASSKTLSDPTPPVAVTSNVTICAGTSLNLNASGGTSGTTPEYIWSGPNSFSSTSQNPLVSSTATTAMAGIYTIIVSNSSACTAMATANVIINVTPATPSPNAIAPINSGSSATLTASGCAGTLLWYATIGDVPVTNPVSPSTTTDYYATCQVSANGITCISPRSANVSVTIFSNQIIYVNITNTNPTQNGITWATAFSNLQTGLTTASGISGTSVEVWVAQGTYKPTNTTDRNISFNIPTGVKVYGGFVGTESDISTRDFRTNSSILSGEIGNINSTTDNSRHVVYFDNSNNITTLDGFTITAGNADFDPRFVANLPLPSAPTSTAQTRGGGILIERGSNPLIKNCLIVNNSAVSGGGILAVDGSLPIISYCKIMGNQAAFGPGIYLQDGSNANVSNTLLSGNRGIGAFYNNVSNPTITNCTLSGNGGYNGGIFNSNSQPVIKNSIIWGNSTPFNDTQSVITYSIIQGGYAGVGNLNYDPQFVTQMPDGISPNLAGDYHLRANSLAIDRGDNGTIALTDRDLDRNLRRYAGGQVDMGAFEFQGIATVSLVISVQTGNWETNATWDIGRVPQLGDYVIINTNHTITLNGTGTAKNVESRNNSVIRFGNTSARLNIGF